MLHVSDPVYPACADSCLQSIWRSYMSSIEERMRRDNRKYYWQTIEIALAVVIAVAGLILGLVCFPLRPEKSDFENRELEKFPEFSKESFIDGSYFSSIERWFADTFPFREELLITEKSLQTAYGLQKDTVSHTGEGEDDLEALLKSLQEAEASSQNTETLPSESSELPSSQEAVSDVGSSTEVPETSPVPSETSREYVYDPEEGNTLYRNNPQEAGNVNVKDLVGYCVFGFNQPAAKLYCENVALLAERAKDVATVYDILVPDNSAIMLDDETKAAWKLLDERKVFDVYFGYLNSVKTSDNIVTVDIYDTMMEHNDEYLYFKTDHHWTQLGAYYAYSEFCKAAGMQAHDLSEYEQLVMDNFLGSYYKTNGYAVLADNPDTITAYLPLSGNEFRFFDTYVNDFRTGKIIRDLSQETPYVKYMSFIYGDNPISYLENDTIQNGKKCIVVKESFGNTFVPFLKDMYETVIVIDYRYYLGDIVQLAKDEGVTDIIFINNCEAISDVWTMNHQFGRVCRGGTEYVEP